MLQPRLERAAMNQLTDGDATLSRYAIWAETVRGIVLDALERFSSAKGKMPVADRAYGRNDRCGIELDICAFVDRPFGRTRKASQHHRVSAPENECWPTTHATKKDAVTRHQIRAHPHTPDLRTLRICRLTSRRTGIGPTRTFLCFPR